jgi:hypothetical protein
VVARQAKLVGGIANRFLLPSMISVRRSSALMGLLPVVPKWEHPGAEAPAGLVAFHGVIVGNPRGPQSCFE